MELTFMEVLLRLEADAKHWLGMTDRSYEQTLMDEMLKILEEAELLFGPRDRSYELLPPRITECGCARPHILPFRKIRIYLTAGSTTPSVASYYLAHELVHVLGPTQSRATTLEEGLATYFSHEYMKRVHGLRFRAPNRFYDGAMRAVAPLMARNKFVIRELRTHQPQISKIDERLLVEVAGIEPEHAKILCANFDRSWLGPANWNEYASRGAQLFVNGFHSMWEEWT
jgi:hypothetical protein